MKFKSSALKLLAGMAIALPMTTAMPATAATTDTSGITYEKLLKSATNGGAGLTEMLGIDGGGISSLLNGGAFFGNGGGAANDKAIKSIGQLLGINIPNIGLSGDLLGDANTSKVLGSAVQIMQGKNVQKSAGTLLTILNSAKQTELKDSADKTAEDSAVPLASSIKGVNESIVQVTDFVDSVDLNPQSSLDAMTTANQLKAQEIRLKAATAGTDAAKLSQGQETNQRLATIAAGLEEQTKRAQAQERGEDATRSATAENDLRGRTAQRALTTGSYNQTKFFNF
jgi:hypothetical protein